MKKVYVITGLKEIPLLDGYGDERNYIVSVHIDTVESINDAETMAAIICSQYEHGIEIKIAYVKIKN